MQLNANNSQEQLAYHQVSTQHYCSSFVHAHPRWISSNFHPSSACLHDPLPNWRLTTLSPSRNSPAPVRAVPSSSSGPAALSSPVPAPSSAEPLLLPVVVSPNAIEFSGPVFDDGSQISFGNFFSGATTTTFPILGGKAKREGYPICDQFYVEARTVPSILFALADAASWGKAAKEAVNRAINAFKQRLENGLKEATDLAAIGQILIESIHLIHQRITEGKSDIWEAETTSFLGGVILPMDASNQIGSFVPVESLEVAQLPTWAILFANVGTCRVFHYSAALGKAKDLTGNVYPAYESLARLGPSYRPTGQSDLRNLALHATCGSVGDIILILSDGIVDNLHPKYYGYTPKHFSLPADEWAIDISDPVEKAIISSFQEAFIERLIHREAVIAPTVINNVNKVQPEMKPSVCTSTIPILWEDKLENSCSLRDSAIHPHPEDIVTRLIDHVLQLTQSGRAYFIGKAQKQLPVNFVTLTGKMDHASVVCIKLPSLEEYLRLVNADDLQIIQRSIEVP